MRVSLVLALGAAVTVAAEGCHGDNLLRGMERHNASAYCSSVLFTVSATTTLTMPDGVPTGSEPGPISSACSCLLGIDSAVSRTSCQSKTASWTESPGFSTETTATDASSTVDSDIVGRPTATNSDIGGGYSFSFPNGPLTSTTASTCGWAEATTTVQVTETSVETVYVTSLPATAGRPPPSSTSGLSTVDAEATSSDAFSVITLSGEPSGTAPAWVSTVTLSGDSTSGIPILTTVTSGSSTIVSTITGTPLRPPQGRPVTTFTLIIGNTVTTITGELLDPSSPTSTLPSSSQSSDTSQWTLSSISGSTESTPTATPTPRLTTITSDIGNGVISTWIVTLTGTGIPFPNTTSSTGTIGTQTQSAEVSVTTSLVAGGATTILVTEGSTVVQSGNSSLPTASSTPPETVSAGFSVITTTISGQATTITAAINSTVWSATSSLISSSPTASESISSGFTIISTVIGGIATTFTVSDGSTLTPESQSPTSALTTSTSEASAPISTVITSVIGGIVTILTVIGGSTVTPSTASSTTTSTTSPSETLPPGFSVITSTVSGAATIITISGNSTLSPSSSTTLAASPIVTGSITVITSLINGAPSTWTVSDGSTLVASNTTSSTPSSNITSATPTPTDGVVVITGVISGQASTWTVSDGITLGIPSSNTTSSTPTPTTGIVTVTTIIGGAVSTFTVSDGVTLGGTNSSTSTSLTPTGGIITVTTIINGEPSTWIISDGITLGPITSTTSPPPTATGVTVITSTISGQPSIWTISNGLTLSESGVSNATSTPTQTPTPTGGFTVITTVINGVASTWTISDGVTISGTSTPAPTATGVITVISSVIGGGASTWVVSNGVTLPASSNSTTATPTPIAQVTVITSSINGAASTWTVSNGSTLTGSPTSTSTPTPTGNVITLTSTAFDGSVSIWTITGGVASTTSLNTTSSTPTSSTTSTAASSTSSGFDSAFTGITIVAAQSATTCYSLPALTESLHESLLDNEGREPPYIDAFYFNETTSAVQYLRLVNTSSDPILLDVSDPSRLAVIDKDGDVLSIDSQGLHFTSARCSPKIDIFISGFFEQLNALTNSTCGGQPSISASGTPDLTAAGSQEKRQVRAFDVLLRLKDQCGDPARADLPVAVALGESQCVVSPRDPGDFLATCAFPGGERSSAECETSVQQTLERLTQGSFAGTCPSFTSVWTLLFQQLSNIIDIDRLLKPFVDAGLDVDTDTGRSILSNIDSYLDLFDYSTSTFKNSTSQAGSGLGDMIEGYGVTTIQTQVCRSLLNQDSFNLTFTAGLSTTPSLLAEISTIPSPTPEYERNVADPTGVACCPNPGKCIIDGESRRYPNSSQIEGSDCLCGARAEGGGIAFRTGRCLGYDQCNTTSPCAAGSACLVDNCCGFSVCVNGTECSAPKVQKRWASLFGSDTSAGIF